MKSKNKIRGRIPGLVKMFSNHLKNSLVIVVPEGKFIIHTDGSFYHTRDYKIKK